MESTIETLYKSIQHLDHCVRLSPPFPLTRNPPQSLKELEKTESHQEWSNLWNRFLLLEKKIHRGDLTQVYKNQVGHWEGS